jgi:antitoxin MazE
MKARLIRIGNSRGIRLPKAILQEAGLEDEVEIRVRSGSIVITPAKRPRAGWAEAAARRSRDERGKLLDPYVPTRFDEEEWRW